MALKKNERLAPPLMFAFRTAHEKRDAKQGARFARRRAASA